MENNNENKNANGVGAAAAAASSLQFLAIRPFVERTIITPREVVVAGKDWVRWGDKNAYPDYIESLCAECTTLRSVQAGLVDYVVGNGVTVTGSGTIGSAKYVDGASITFRALVEASAKDVARLGGFAWELIPDREGRLSRIVPLRLKYIRLNKEGNVVYYSEKWNKGGSVDVLVYGRWQGEFARVTNPKTGEESWRSAVLLSRCWGDNVYPEPVYAAAVKACETERGVDEFHLGNLERGFMGTYIVNLCNGVIPTDEVKAQIERDFQQKYTGARNAGRVMLNFATDKDHLAVLQKMDVADFADKYSTLEKSSRQKIFTAFRANPNLFGIPTEDNGFNAEEYESTFRLFNRTMVRPIQEKICEAWAAATGGTMTIAPFTLDGAEQEAGGTGAQPQQQGEE